MSEASMPHCARCDRVEYDCACGANVNGTHGTAKVGGKTIALGKWSMSKPQPVAVVEPAPAVSDDLRNLLAAVIANPDDDTARLVYADELDQCAPFGATLPTPRAELIRVQCELARTPRFLPTTCDVCGNSSDEYGSVEHGRGCYVVDEDGGGSTPADPNPAYDDLRERANALLVPVLNALGLARKDHWFARGFITTVRAAWDVWAAHGDGLRAREWVPAVVLTSRPDWPSFPTRGKPGAFEYEIAGAWVPVGVVGYLTRTHDEQLCNLLARRWPGTKFELPKAVLPGHTAYGDADGGFLVPVEFTPGALFATPELVADSAAAISDVLMSQLAAEMMEHITQSMGIPAHLVTGLPAAPTVTIYDSAAPAADDTDDDEDDTDMEGW